MSRSHIPTRIGLPEGRDPVQMPSLYRIAHDNGQSVKPSIDCGHQPQSNPCSQSKNSLAWQVEEVCEKEAWESVDAAIAAQQVDGNGHFMVSRKRRSAADSAAAAVAAVVADEESVGDEEQNEGGSEVQANFPRDGRRDVGGNAVQNEVDLDEELKEEKPQKCQKHALCTRKYRHPGLCKIVQQVEPLATVRRAAAHRASRRPVNAVSQKISLELGKH